MPVPWFFYYYDSVVYLEIMYSDISASILIVHDGFDSPWSYVLSREFCIHLKYKYFSFGKEVSNIFYF